MAELIIGLVGPFGSGKTTAARFLEKECNASVYGSGDVLREVATSLRIPHTREHLVRLGGVLVAHYHPEVVSRAVRDRAMDDIAQLVVVEGFRFPQDVAVFRSEPRFRLVAIHADTEQRWHRCRERTQNPDERDMTLAQFRAMEERETERHIRALMQGADKHLYNVGRLDQLHEMLRGMLHDFDWRAPVPG